MISYKMYEKNLISSINVNVMHHFWKKWHFIYFIEKEKIHEPPESAF